jgi:hypothetical protein
VHMLMLIPLLMPSCTLIVSLDQLIHFLVMRGGVIPPHASRFVVILLVLFGVLLLFVVNLLFRFDVSVVVIFHQFLDIVVFFFGIILGLRHASLATYTIFVFHLLVLNFASVIISFFMTFVCLFLNRHLGRRFFLLLLRKVALFLNLRFGFGLFRFAPFLFNFLLWFL